MTDLTTSAASAFVAAAGLELDEVSGTKVVGHIDLSAEHHTPWGVVHGGVYTTAVESAAVSVRARQWQTAASSRSVCTTAPTSSGPAPKVASTWWPYRFSRAVSSSCGRLSSPLPTPAKRWPVDRSVCRMCRCLVPDRSGVQDRSGSGATCVE